MNSFSFTPGIKDTETQARVGIIHTSHGDIETPAFVPVGTQASVKSLTPEEITEVGTQLFFVNTYHMAMRPGIDIVEHLGGLHKLMQWNGPIITDSGGFQVFSLGRKKFSNGENTEEGDPTLVKITEDGVTFRSHWDGGYHEFTPELSMQYQWKLGSDIHIVFDDCTPYPVTHEEAKKSMERTHRWAVRSVGESEKLKTKSEKSGQKYQALYGSVQGSIYEDLRKTSAEFISSLNTDGIALGGMAVGESKGEMEHVLGWVCPVLPENKPRHLLGVGDIDDIFTLVDHGIDTFDCVLPTRLARSGQLFSHSTFQPFNFSTIQPLHPKSYRMDITNSIFARDVAPIDVACSCYTCRTFSRAYLHHLFKVRELLAYRLATIHNLFFIHSLVGAIAESIKRGEYVAMKKQWI